MENDKKPKLELIDSIDQLNHSITKLTEIQRKIAKQNKLGPTLIRATAYALGSTLGLAIVISILFYILKALGIFDSLSNLLQSAKDLKSLY